MIQHQPLVTQVWHHFQIDVILWMLMFPFSCGFGFERAGSLFSICQTNYTWSPKPPVCLSSKEKSLIEDLLVDFYVSKQGGEYKIRK